MENSRSNCTFCGEVQTISSDKVEVFVKHLQNAFLTRNKDCSLEEFSDKLRLCVICAQKIQLSVDLKKSYDEMCNRNNRALPTKCYFCEGRSYVLIDTGDNPNDFEKKMEMFHNSVLVQHSYENLCACTKCLYNLHIWSETRSFLSSILKIPDTSDEVLNNNNTEVHLKKSRRSSNRTPIKKLQKNGKFTKGSVDRNIVKFKLHLKRKLKRFKTAKDIMQCGEIHMNGFDIADNDKIFEKIPYVKILVGSQISLNTLKQISNEVVVISDSEDEFDTRPTRRSRYSTPSMQNNRDSSSPYKKTPFKIKFSSSFSKTLKLPDSSSFVCMVCEKQFSVKCEYLLHLLRHQKVESLIVRVAKYNLPQHISVQNFKQQYQTKQKKTVTTRGKVINRLLVKYIGEDTANTFEESDEFEKLECTSTSSEIEGNNETTMSSPTTTHEVETADSTSQEIINNNDENRNVSPIIPNNDNVADQSNTECQTIGSLQNQTVSTEQSTDEAVQVESSNQNDENEKNSDEVRNEENDDSGVCNDAISEHVQSMKENLNVDENNVEIAAEDNIEDEELSDSATEILINTADDTSGDLENIDITNKNNSEVDNNDSTIVTQNEEEISDTQVDSVELSTIHKDTVEKDFIEKETVEKGIVEEDTVEEDTVEEDTIEEDTVEEDTVEEDTVEKDTVEKDNIAKDSIEQDSAEKGSTDIEKKEEGERRKRRLSLLCKSHQPILTSQELLSILDSSIANDEYENNGGMTTSVDLTCDESKLQPNRSEYDNETPKRKRVRFANEKEIVTPDRTVILFEKLDRTDEDNTIEID